MWLISGFTTWTNIGSIAEVEMQLHLNSPLCFLIQHGLLTTANNLQYIRPEDVDPMRPGPTLLLLIKQSQNRSLGTHSPFFAATKSDSEWWRGGRQLYVPEREKKSGEQVYSRCHSCMRLSWSVHYGHGFLAMCVCVCECFRATTKAVMQWAMTDHFIHTRRGQLLHPWQIASAELSFWIKPLSLTTNNTAERAVKLMTDYAQILTKDENMRQWISQAVDGNRKKFPELKKKTLNHGD